ncbi:DUF2336 domain-containing protein [Sphingomonas rubra]|uniref:DUF2336 domain-containing protein n=1 Tax=Sphingomonas rubra TaxID=634430 RepID=A0A1I5S113_9SPHN|nr:DUF2336 domain-containing protein [Sphingomonas rubra]SFP64364.1 hypothetical protein SAMN04488241_104275 [Sphingomonas rubra]
MVADEHERDRWAPERLSDRAARADARADRDLAAAATDFLLPDEARLNDRTRHGMAALVRGTIDAVETAVRHHAARLLAERGATERAEALLRGRTDVTARLLRGGLLRDPDMMAELLARVRQDGLAAALPPAPAVADQPSLVVRLAAAPDAVVARAAAALLVADNRRRDAAERAAESGGELPAELHHRLVWWVAAAIRDPHDHGTDLAIAEAALRAVAAHDEDERADAVAMRLAAAIAPNPRELPDLLVEALADRRVGLFTALVAHAAGLPHEAVRAVTLEPGGDRLWLALRAIALDRATIARIALALAEADPTRDIDAFADQLDAIMAVDPVAARAALLPLTLHADYRAAIRALARSEAG